jgi:hypothetical protein
MTTISRPVAAMIAGQFVLALVLFWVLPISKAADAGINLTLGSN